MKPYYEDGLVTLYHGDCRDLLAAILSPVEELTYPDVIVTDPPYGIGYSPGGGGRGFRSQGPPGVIRKAFTGKDVVRGDDRPFDPAFLLALSLPTVLFGANHYADRLPASPSWLVWDKRDGLPSNDFADCEMAWTNLGGPARLFSHRWSGLTKDSERGQRRTHPTQKPVALMAWVIERCPPGLIIDPYAGSATTLMAAKRLSRRAVGIEIEERWCEDAANRLSQEVLGLVG